MWSVQKVSLWPRARYILQVGRAQRAKTPISHPPKTPNLPPPRGTLTHRQRQKKHFLLCHYLLLSYNSFAVLTWLFSAVSPPTLSYLFSLYRKSSIPYFVCPLLPLLLLFLVYLVTQTAWCFLFHHSLISLFCHSFVSSFPSFWPSLHPSLLNSFCSPFLPHWNGVLCNASFLSVTK